MAVVVNPGLVREKVRGSEVLEKIYGLLDRDEEVNALQRMSNVMAVGRLLYNDHGPVHARIVSGSALEIFDLLLDYGVMPSTLSSQTLEDVEEAKAVVLIAAFLHDIGNSVHREQHELIGAMMAERIIERIVGEVFPDWGISRRVFFKSEVMHAIYATAPNVRALTVEASAVKVADATDMAEGRARIPYMRGKLDMHSLSAISIKQVSITRGSLRPVRIEVRMASYAGFFQIERVLLPKIETSTIREYVEIAPYIIGESGEEPLQPIFP
ncbi:MAG: HD domain-containing protein [Aeropyrum sp.]|nr:HD domain-containing protein [Aeropyrum sp.]